MTHFFAHPAVLAPHERITVPERERAACRRPFSEAVFGGRGPIAKHTGIKYNPVMEKNTDTRSGSIRRFCRRFLMYTFRGDYAMIKGMKKEGYKRMYTATSFNGM